MLGIPVEVWLIVIGLAGLYILWLIRANMPMEPTAATAARIETMYDSDQSQNWFKVYVASDLPDSIGIAGVVANFKRSFGDVVVWQDGYAEPANWPEYTGWFSRRKWKWVRLTPLSTIP